MRYLAATFLLALIIGAAGFFYWNNYQSKKENPLTYCPEDVELIFVSQSTAQLEIFLEDSNSFFSSSPAISSFAHRITSFVKPLHENKDSVFIACSIVNDSPKITVIFSPDASTKQLGVQTATGNWNLLTNYEATISPTVEKLNPDLSHALKSLNAPSGIILKPSILTKFLDQLIDDVFTEAIIKELESVTWLGFGLESNYPFVTSAIARASNGENDCQGATSTLFKLPIKTNASLSSCKNDTVTAMIHVPYNRAPENWTDNVFLIRTSFNQDTNAYPVNKPVSIEMSALPMPINNWNQNTIVALNLGSEIVFAPNSAQLGRFYQDYKSYNFLTKSVAFQKLKTSVSDASLCLYLSGLNNYDQPSPAHFEDTAYINAFIFQANTEISKAEHFTFSALYNESTQSTILENWRTQLDTRISGGPWKFINHYTKEVELLVQDENDQLYLLNMEGKTLWKKRVNGQVNEEIVMIDAFKSNKNQILFTTENSVQLIDRNGNNVDGFPIKLNNKTSIPPTAVSYSDQDELRILICDGAQIRNFKADGSAVDGWKNPSINGSAVSKVHHMYTKGKDYLMVLNNSNQLLIFDRAGNSKSSPIEFPQHAQFTEIVKASSLIESTIVGYDTAGHLIEKRFDGELNERNILPTGSIQFITTNNGVMRYVIFTDGRLFGLDQKGDMVTDILLPSKKIGSMKWLDQEQTILGLYDNKERKMTLVNVNESVIINNALKTDEQCLFVDLDQDGSKELIIHSGDGSVASLPDL